LVYGGVGIGLVWFLDDLDATHNPTPKKAPRQRDGSRLTCRPAQRAQLCPGAPRGLPAADRSETRRRFHGYRGQRAQPATGCRGPG
jgi:hypothetical protein